LHDSSRASLGDSEFALAITPGPGLRAVDDRISELLATLIDAPDPTPEVGARKPAATGYGDLAAIVRLQSTELERLALENERLMDRLEAFIRLQENEHKLRQELQDQVQRLGERPAAPTPAYDLDMVRRTLLEAAITVSLREEGAQLRAGIALFNTDEEIDQLLEVTGGWV
jgi:hypothetical protein